MKVFQLYFLLIIITCMIHLHCKGSLDPENYTFTGITKTTNEGTILVDDPNDWQPRSNQSDALSVSPAYPNPFNDVCTIVFRLNKEMDVKIAVNDTPTHVVLNLVNDFFPAGIHSIRDNMGEEYEEGIYRVYFTANDEEGNTYTSFGDIHLKRHL